MPPSEWTIPECVARYMDRADGFPRRAEGESVLFEHVPCEPIENKDASDRLLDLQTQLEWLRAIGFDDVDCYWKSLEMALLVGVKPPQDALPLSRTS